MLDMAKGFLGFQGPGSLETWAVEGVLLRQIIIL